MLSVAATCSFGAATIPSGEKPARTAPAIEPTWDSLRQYPCPEWFQDAKFGIYAHWGVYSAADGTKNTDWYGRNMYGGNKEMAKAPARIP